MKTQTEIWKFIKEEKKRNGNSTKPFHYGTGRAQTENGRDRKRRVRGKGERTRNH